MLRTPFSCRKENFIVKERFFKVQNTEQTRVAPAQSMHNAIPAILLYQC